MEILQFFARQTFGQSLEIFGFLWDRILSGNIAALLAIRLAWNHVHAIGENGSHIGSWCSDAAIGISATAGASRILLVRRCPSRLPKAAGSICFLRVYSNNVGLCGRTVWRYTVQERTGEPEGFWICIYWARMRHSYIYSDAARSVFAMRVHTEADIIYSQSDPDFYGEMDIWHSRHICLGSIFLTVFLSQ